MSNAKRVNLALQGGGAHGAFGWGVLDYLLEDGRIAFDGVSATSAGAMNAAVMAYGMSQGGPDLAREKLESFWRAVSRAGGLLSIGTGPALDQFKDAADAASWAGFAWLDAMTRASTPYDFNPFNLNPLRDILEDLVDFDALRACPHTNLFVCATNVRTGKAKIFKTRNINSDVVLASACLPLLYQAVEIDGEHYWDGGFMGNPSLWPLFYSAESRDIVVVHLNPMERPALPVRPAEIANRINEISFNSSLLKEMRAIAFVQRLISQDMLRDEHKHRYRHVLFHSIRCDKSLRDLSVASKYNTNWAFLQDLRDRGREVARNWLDASWSAINERSTVDLQAEFLEGEGDS